MKYFPHNPKYDYLSMYISPKYTNNIHKYIRE